VPSNTANTHTHIPPLILQRLLPSDIVRIWTAIGTALEAFLPQFAFLRTPLSKGLAAAEHSDHLGKSLVSFAPLGGGTEEERGGGERKRDEEEERNFATFARVV
jgi:hypothetical protein